MRALTRKQVARVLHDVATNATEFRRRGHGVDRSEGFNAGIKGWPRPDFIDTRKPGEIRAYDLGYRVGEFMRGEWGVGDA